jgi:hypothetical protein
MTIHDLVWIATGEILLAITFCVGVFTGIALSRKDSK